MRRPLQLIDGRAYAATWLTVKRTLSESKNKHDEIVRHEPPLVETRKQLFVVRDDGVVFGEPGNPLENLGFQVHLNEIPLSEKLWSTRGIKAYRKQERPNPARVFQQLVETVDRFIDFDHSLADQRTMCELVACYILATWFLDGFNVIGFLWANGDRGAGKTQLLLVVCTLAYLGQLILASGSYATLRDLADYGAALGFDDAESASDPRRSDPDKRNLLLAGNRRGSTVTVKEPVGDRWQTRHVNAFCPRLFSATMLPDAILASRTIIIPLVRTPDRTRANADPSDPLLYSHPIRQLVDHLWALSLEHLAHMPQYETFDKIPLANSSALPTPSRQRAPVRQRAIAV